MGPRTRPASERAVSEQPSRTESPLWAALLTVGSMVALILVSIVLFGQEAEGGPLQVSMTLGLVIAILVAKPLGHSIEELTASMTKSISSALGTIFVLLAIGALIGALFLSGTIASVVYYGAAYGFPRVLYVLVLVIATVLAYAIGSSFTTIAAVGLPFVALAPAMEVSPQVTAAAAVVGAFTGDALGRISDTFILTTSVVGVEPRKHQRAMLTVLAPGWLASAALFVVLGLREGSADGYDSGPIRQAIESQFSVSLVAFLPLIVVLLLATRTTAFLALMAGAVTAVVMAAFTQQDLIARLAGNQGLGALGDWVYVSLETMGNGFHLSSGTDTLDTTFSGGGVVSMLTTIWLILVAAAFGALVDHTGMLQRLLRPLIAWATSGAKLITASAVTSIGLNAATADPYMSIILGSSTYRSRFIKARLEPYVESTSIAASGSIFSPLVPWNVHGAFVAGTLGITVLSFAPYAVMLWITPIVLILIGIAKFSHAQIPPAQDAADTYGAEPEKLPERRTSV